MNEFLGKLDQYVNYFTKEKVLKISGPTVKF